MINHSYAGKFIVLEGIDGAGTTTQTKLLAEYLEKRGIKVCVTEEPWSGGLRKQIKEIIGKKSALKKPYLDALAFTTDRAIHQEKLIKPKLNEGYWVVSDRYYHSTFAYQGAEKISFSWICSLHRYIIQPDLAIILDITAEEALKRLKKSERSARDRFENLPFLTKLRSKYLGLRGKLPEVRIVSGMGSEKEVLGRILDTLKSEGLLN